MAGIGSRYRSWIMEQSIGGVAPTRLDNDRFRFSLSNTMAEVNLYPLDNDDVVELLVERVSDGDSTFFLHFELGNDLAHARELFNQMAEALTEQDNQQVAHVLLTCTSAFTTSMHGACIPWHTCHGIAEATGLQVSQSRRELTIL